MKTLFKNKETEILSLDGLRFTTDFDCIDRDSTHVPLFNLDQNEYFVAMGNELRKFHINKTLYGFRYYDDNDVLSPYWTAIFCQIEGEESECVILGHFYQNADADTMDSSWELPCGCYRPVTKFPRIFYKSKEDFVRDYSYSPSLYRVRENEFVAYRYDQMENRAVECRVKISAYYYIGHTLHVERCGVDEQTLFSNSYVCTRYNREKIIETNNNK